MGNDETEKKGELTRRQWLLKLGEAAAIVGASGGVSEAEAKSLQALFAEAASAPQVPPGLYLPSNDHLRHALSTDDLFHPVPAGSQTDYRRPPSGQVQPQFFSDQEFQIVLRIVELVLGEPAGNREAGSVSNDVAEWVDLRLFNSAGVREAARKLRPEHRTLAIRYHGRVAVEKLENDDPQAICRQGLAWLAEAAQRKYGKAFLALDEAEQIELLKTISDEPKDRQPPEAGARFFRLMKTEILRGFYTTRAGLKELDYKGNSFYPQSPGCEHPGHSGPSSERE